MHCHVAMNADANLMEIIAACSTPRRLPSMLNSRQDDRDQQSNDSKRDQHLDES